MSNSAAFSGRHYTLERDNRELQRLLLAVLKSVNYTLERDNRELQLLCTPHGAVYDYTLERDNRELQRSIRKPVFVIVLYP